MLHGAWMLSAQDFHFTHYPFDPEFREIKGHTLHRAQNNLLYIGTDRGLLEFDGISYSAMTIAGMGGDVTEVTAISSDSTLLWLGTSSGAVFFGLPGHFQIYRAGVDVPVRALSVTRRGTLVATYGSGLVITGDSIPDMHRPELPSQDLYAMAQSPDGNVWVASDAGISCVKQTHPWTITHFDKSDGIRDEINICLTRSEDGVIWAGSFEHGFCGIDSRQQVTYPVADWEYGPILSMTSVGDRELWISTEQHGVFRFVRDNGRLEHVALPGHSTPVIVAMESDPEGNVWLLDVYRGLYRTNRRFEEYRSVVPGIQAMMFDHTGQFYAGNPDGLFAVGSPGQVSTIDDGEVRLVLDGVNVVSMYEDRHRNLWVGTFGQGLWCRPYGRNEWYHYRKENGLTDESVMSISGRQDTLWLATLGGVTRMRTEPAPDRFRLQSTNYNLADGLGTNFIYTAFADARGRIWFGTDGNGLSVLEGSRITNFHEVDSTLLHSVYSIAEDASGQIWFVTDRDGVFRYDGDQFTVLSLPNPDLEQEISSLVADPHGNIVLAHTDGVDIITGDGHVVLYRSMGNDGFNPNLNAFCKDTSGAIWIAGESRILKYNALGSAVRNHPHTILSGVSVFLTPVDFTMDTVYRANENYLTFSFKGLWYTQPDAVSFRYKLVGLDPDWSHTRETSVTYQNLRPGSYQFVVESSGSGQFEASHGVSYAFQIRKPYYQTVWFVVLVGTLCILAVYFWLRVRDHRLQRASALERRQIESQLQTLKAQINPHFLFNSFNTLVSVIEEDPGAAVAYVEKLSDFYRSILQYREKNLIPLSEELDIVRTYAHLLKKRYGSALHLEIEEHWPETWIVPLVLQILVENAVKHNVISERRPLTIRIAQHPSGAVIVENNLQRKPAARDSTGFGLESLVSRYALLTRRPVQIGQTDNNFYVIVPVLEHHEVPDY